MFLRINTQGLKQVYYNEEKDLVIILHNGTCLVFSNTELVRCSSDVNGLIIEISEKT